MMHVGSDNVLENGFVIFWLQSMSKQWGSTAVFPRKKIQKRYCDFVHRFNLLYSVLIIAPSIFLDDYPVSGTR